MIDNTDRWRLIEAAQHQKRHLGPAVVAQRVLPPEPAPTPALAPATPVLLLRSRAHLPRLSPHVGRNLSLTADAGFGAVVPDHVVDGYRGKIISTICYSYLKESGFVFEDLHYLPIASAVSFPTAYESTRGPGSRSDSMTAESDWVPASRRSTRAPSNTSCRSALAASELGSISGWACGSSERNNSTS